MNIDYYEDTDSFAVSFGAARTRDTVPVTHDFFVDVDSDDRLCGVESINASRHLRIDDFLTAPPRFTWLQLAANEPYPARLSVRDRFFVYRADQDTLFMEFAGGVPAETVQVTDGIDTQVDDDGVASSGWTSPRRRGDWICEVFCLAEYRESNGWE